MVQAADFWNLHDPASCGQLDRPGIGCVLVEREVGASSMVIGTVTGQYSAQVSVAQDENVVETLAPDRTDQALGERILPGAVRRRENFLDQQALHAVAELLAIYLVAVAQEIRGAESSGKALTICRAVQAAVGCSVTLKWTTRRR